MGYWTLVLIAFLGTDGTAMTQLRMNGQQSCLNAGYAIDARQQRDNARIGERWLCISSDGRVAP